MCDIKRLVTKSGHRITVVDTPGKETISIATPQSNRFMLTESLRSTGGRPAIVLETQGDLILAAPNGRIHQQAMFRSADIGNQTAAALLAKSNPKTTKAAQWQVAMAAGTSAKPNTSPCADKGMDTLDRKQKFAAKMKGLQKQWKHLSSDERLTNLKRLVNDSTNESGVPPVSVVTGDISPSFGSFSANTWSMTIDKSLISSKSLSNEQTAKLGGTLYHKSRHSEQSYMTARNVASEKLPDDQVQKQCPILKEINTAASKQPLDKTDPQWQCSQLMRDTMYGPGAQHRSDATRQAVADQTDVKSKLDDFTAAANDHNGSLEKVKAANDALDKAKAKADVSYLAYRQLPNEADAWATGDSVKNILHH